MLAPCIDPRTVVFAELLHACVTRVTKAATTNRKSSNKAAKKDERNQNALKQLFAQIEESETSGGCNFIASESRLHRFKPMLRSLFPWASRTSASSFPELHEIFMLRSPEDHVISMWSHCQDKQNSNITQCDFRTWVRGGYGASKRCCAYCAHNAQTNHIETINTHSKHMHHTHALLEAEAASTTLERAAIVGVVEHYI